MKSPTCNIGDWKIRYKQVPYENRYFILSKESDIEYKFSMSAYEDYGDSLLPFELYSILTHWYRNGGRMGHHWLRFLDRVYKYNRVLDNES